MSNLKIINGDCRTALRELADESVQCCVTSPPYWGLRDYGHPDQIGQEKTPDEFVQTMVVVFREVRRVLRNDGTVWLNLGDSYAGSNRGVMADGSVVGGSKQKTNRGTVAGVILKTNDIPGLKPKDLIGIPWRVALALQADGWYLRSDIIWAKQNCMPESVTDRPTRSHEYIFLLTKSPKYFYDHEAIKEPSKDISVQRANRGVSENHKNLLGAPGQPPHSLAQPRQNKSWKGSDFHDGKNLLNHPNVGKNRKKDFDETQGGGGTGLQGHSGNAHADGTPYEMANKRDVWTVSPAQFREAHFATYPPPVNQALHSCGNKGGRCSARSIRRQRHDGASGFRTWPARGASGIKPEIHSAD